MRNKLGILVLSVVLAAVMLAALVVPLAASGLRSERAAPAAVAQPLKAGMAVPLLQATPDAKNDWQRIQADGKIVVGTALDNPPFSYYNDTFQPDGFDIALMTELARRMGVEVQFLDFAFEGLGGALQLGQIDAAIAAISITPERQAKADFSKLYYLGEDGILAKSDSPITAILSVSDLAKLRVGVQRGSIYESWLRDTVIATGQMPASNLLSYAKPEHAVRDVQADRADVAILDLPVAESFVQQGGVKLVGRGLYPQSYGIAVRKGSSLLTPINQALTQVQADGTSAELIEEYLDIPQSPAGTPTATPTPTPTPCINGMEVVAHLSYDDKNMTAPPKLNPGAKFTKSWRIKNTGTCTWVTEFTFNYAGGNTDASRMGGKDKKLGKTVQPGLTWDIKQDLVAPTTPGTYQGLWQLADLMGQPFGEKASVGIQVVKPPPPTPKPTQTPAPGIYFTVDRTNITAGECVTFRWDVSNVKAVYFYKQGENYQNHGVAGQGSKQECPGQTTVYELRVEKKDGTVEFRQIQINVQPSTSAPDIREFNNSPDEISVGQCVNFWWTVTGAVDRVAFVRKSKVLWDYAPTSGSYADCPDDEGTKKYYLQAWGPGGFSEQQIDVPVYPGKQPK